METKKQGTNPKTGKAVSVDRRALHVDADLPRGEEYGRFLRERVEESEAR